METRKKIRVLVIDDSVVFREMLTKILSSDPQIEVAAVASDPFEARDKIVEVIPDVITCDVEMPKMSGIEFVRWLLPKRFFPVVMVSSLDRAVFDAMSAGAVDFVVKPGVASLNTSREFAADLIQKIKAAAASKMTPYKPAQFSQAPQTATTRISDNMAKDTNRIIAIGASTGGTEAIYSILKALPPTIPGIVIVQHIPPVFSKMFAERLDGQTALRVKEAETGDYINPGTAFVAPGDMHMTIKKFGPRYRIECFNGKKVNGHCPSVDVLFDSVAREAGSSAIGIQLTGMGYDGAKGLLAIRRKGGRTIGQDEASSVVYGMPKVAFDIGGVETQAALDAIPQSLLNLLK